ncbi:chromate efflux transporter [Candidatus Gracilibacteria bacterium]|nr:chromate efflux transporter [Candidatus Gracilibacteria bacterium]
MASTGEQVRTAASPIGSAFEVFVAFLRLGLTSFGGPIAHIGYFRNEFVERRKWLDDRDYADIVALCQFLPGPASSQVGISLGLMRAGLLGSLAAWIGFTTPSVLAMATFALVVSTVGDISGAGWLQGLKIVAVAVVAQAVWGMATKLCPDRARASFAVAAAVLMLVWPTAIAQVLVIVLAGLAGYWLLPKADRPTVTPLRLAVPRVLAIGSWVVLALLLFGLPLLLQSGMGGHTLALFDAFFRTGALVFGGGHVVLPLLEASVVGPGWVNAEQFIAGYGAAQAVPGPLFTFAAYLGAINNQVPNGWAGALLAIVAIFLPSFLILFGALPLWDRLRAEPAAQSALNGINAAVVGLLIAALYTPVWTSAIAQPVDLAIALVAFLLLQFWKLPPWLVVLLAALAGALIR